MSVAWGAGHGPSRATSSGGLFRRKVPQASTDSLAGSLSPATKASNIRRLLWPNTSDTTVARLMLGASSILYPRLLACVRLGTRDTRGRVRSRQARIAGAGTQRGVINPCASRSAIQVASLVSVLFPGRCRPSRLVATHTSTVSLNP
jgi:hypothetical protein